MIEIIHKISLNRHRRKLKIDDSWDRHSEEYIKVIALRSNLRQHEMCGDADRITKLEKWERVPIFNRLTKMRIEKLRSKWR